MASPSDLISLAAVQAWLGGSTDSANLAPLISQISRKILTEIGRPRILPTLYTEVRGGDGRSELTLRNWPIVSISQLLVNGQAIASAPTPVLGAALQTGYVLEQVDPSPPGQMQVLSMRYGWFQHGMQNISITYVAGYQISAEAAVVPATPYQVTALAPFGAWASDRGVAYAASGSQLTVVASSPTVGQYSVSAGLYTFAAADVGASLLISYGYVPLDLAEAAMEWVAERYSYRSRIGQRSKSLGGQETVSFDISAIPAFVASAIQPYRRVIAP